MRPRLYIRVDRTVGLAFVRGKDAGLLCKLAEAAQPGRARPWHRVWNSGWCVPVGAIPDLKAYVETLGEFVVVSDYPPSSRDRSRDLSRAGSGDGRAAQIPGQETLL